MSVTPSCRDFRPRQSSGLSRTEFTSQGPSFDKYRQPEIEIVSALCRAEVEESRTRFKDKSSNTASSTVECQCLLQRSGSGHVTTNPIYPPPRHQTSTTSNRRDFYSTTMANACSIKTNNPKMAVDRCARAGCEVCNNTNFLRHHTNDRLCRVAVPHRIILLFQYRSQFPGVDCRIFTRSLCVVRASSMAKKAAGFSRSDSE